MSFMKNILAAGAIAAVALTQPAAAADIVIRLSHGMPEALDSGQHAWALVFKEAVEARSAGKVEVRILGNNAAGNERQQLERVQNGINQMLLVSEITQPFFFKPALVLGTPFLFSSSEVAWAVLDGPWGKKYNASSGTSKAVSAASSTRRRSSRPRPISPA